MRKIKTFLIEDSGLMRIMISDALRSDPDIELVGTANNGKDGASKSQHLRPDVIVSDMIMPEYDGLYAVRSIMASHPTPVILLSSLGKTTPEIFDALNAGAFDFIDKPQTKNPEEFKSALWALKDKIKLAYGLDSNTLGKRFGKINQNEHTFGSSLLYDILVIGSSTGGPSAVETIVTQLPANLPIPVIIVQHMPERFLISYAQRISTLVPLPVKVSKRNEAICPGVIYVTSGDSNVMLKKESSGHTVFKNSTKTYKEYNHPSVDCMFESVADIFSSKAIGVILTGMGRDGSHGLLEIKKKGGLTIAQDASSCVVNGMPQSAVDIGAVDYIVNLKEIPGFIMSCF
ncbi:chemotaxis-specific protein-glutamate methyltransferase CheB [Fulvivirga sp.]|uniref:chemotaxis-specific protein-glutamate methyltransferase CheB n=1 Tax=Fulvivirga sp. TaxID=1931237 RepID=UPI0032EBB766